MDELQEHLPIELEEEIPKRSRFGWGLISVGILIVFLLGWRLSSAPADFPTKTFLRVPEGASLVEVTEQAELLHLVRSSTLLKIAVKVFGDDKKLQSGDYYFDRPVSFWTVAEYIATGNFNITPARVTILEGMSRERMSKILARDLPYFDAELFMKETADLEGFLFPDTYFISPAADTNDVISILHNAYEANVAPLREAINSSGMTEHDVITLASILEKEAAGAADRATIAGILKNRIKTGMRLQVDAPFLYEYNIGQSQLTPEIIRTDSPYNTYTRSGLTPGPIGSPGLASIKAVLYPAKSNYLFYLHDDNGSVHYATTFAQHKSNIRRYLIN